MAFQIADDVLDLVGQEQRTGKSLGTDLEQRKLTLPLIHLLHRSSAEQARHIRQILTSSDNHKREQLRGPLEQAEALAYATRQAETRAAAARHELQSLPTSECRHILEELTFSVVHRSH